jgi:hypothetical protein
LWSRAEVEAWLADPALRQRRPLIRQNENSAPAVVAAARTRLEARYGSQH